MIVLVNPNIASVYSEYKHSPSQFPIGLAYVASVLEEQGKEVTVIDAAMENLSPKDIAKRIPEDCELVGITVATPLYNESVRIAKEIKKKHDVKVIVGGNHITALHKEIKVKCFDSLFVGEVEETLPKALKEKFKKRTYICKAPKDINGIPLPARHLFKVYEDKRLNGDITTSLITSRGCVGKCKYCVAGNTKNIRLRSVEDIKKELDSIKKMGIKYLNIEDDNFIINKKRTLEICKVLKKYKFKYAAMAIAKFVDKDIAEALAESGCEWLCYGIESGNDEILKSMGRLSTVDDVRKAVKVTKEAGIKVRGTYMLGWVGESANQMHETLDLIRELKADENAISIVTPFPGTEIWDEFVAKRKSVNFDDFCYYNKIGCNLSRVSDERLLNIERKAFNIIKEYKDNGVQMGGVDKNIYYNFFDKKTKLNIFDIGAFNGKESGEFKNMFPNSSVYTIEPLFEVKYKNLNVYKIGFSNYEGKAVIKYPGPAWESLATIVDIKEKYDYRKEIDITTMDKFCQSNNIDNVDIIWCVTNGNELKILEGAANTIKKSKPVITLRLTTRKIYRESVTKEKIIKLLPSDYELFEEIVLPDTSSRYLTFIPKGKNK